MHIKTAQSLHESSLSKLLMKKTLHSAARAGAKQKQLEPKWHQEVRIHNTAWFKLRTLGEHDAHLPSPYQIHKHCCQNQMPLFIMPIPHTPNSHLSPLTSHLSHLTSHLSPLASHLSPLTPQLSPLTAHLCPSHLSPSLLQRSLTAYPKTTKTLIGQHARASILSPQAPTELSTRHVCHSNLYTSQCPSQPDSPSHLS